MSPCRTATKTLLSSCPGLLAEAQPPEQAAPPVALRARRLELGDPPTLVVVHLLVAARPVETHGTILGEPAAGLHRRRKAAPRLGRRGLNGRRENRAERVRLGAAGGAAVHAGAGDGRRRDARRQAAVRLVRGGAGDDAAVADSALVLGEKGEARAREATVQRDVVGGDRGFGGCVCLRVGEGGVAV